MPSGLIGIKWVLLMKRMRGIRAAKMQYATRLENAIEASADLLVSLDMLHHLAADDFIKCLTKGFDLVKIVVVKRQAIIGNPMKLIEELLIPFNLTFDRNAVDTIAFKIGLIRKHPVPTPRIQNSTFLTIGWLAKILR